MKILLKEYEPCGCTLPVHAFLPLQKQQLEIRQMKQQLENELQKLRSSISLDMNLERARSMEDVSICA